MKVSRMLLAGVVSLGLVGGVAAYAEINGLGFNAPTIDDKDNVANPVEGEIVYDVADNTFYGRTDSSWEPLSNVAGITLASGTYTSAASNLLGFSSVSNNGPFKYMRMGNIVTVSGSISATSSSAQRHNMAIPLPVPSDFTDDGDASGTCSFIGGGASATDTSRGGIVYADPNDYAVCRVHPSHIGGGDVIFTFQYVIQ